MLRLLWSSKKIHDVNGTSPCVEAWSRSFFRIISRLESLGSPRSSKWKILRGEHIRNNPTCAVCGNSKKVVPHHIIPYHVDPSKEMEPSNLISLCEGETFNCHLFFGHLRNWSKHNPDVVEDARVWREKINMDRDSDHPQI
jgi:5-methylcytosine-specific restriction protein A